MFDNIGKAVINVFVIKLLLHFVICTHIANFT